MRGGFASPIMWWLSGLAMGASVAFMVGLVCGMAAERPLAQALGDWQSAFIEQCIEAE